MLRDTFSLDDVVTVGDRGIITQTQIRFLREEDVQRITAQGPGGIRKLIEDKSVTPERFDERTLAEIEHPDVPFDVHTRPSHLQLRARPHRDH